MLEQGSANVVWTVAAGDSLGTPGQSNLQRLLVTFGQAPLQAAMNATIRSAVSGSSGVTALAAECNDGTEWYDKTGSKLPNPFLFNNFFGAETLSALGQSARLSYLTTTVGVAQSTVRALAWDFSNLDHIATMTRLSDGVLRYDLDASALPVPAPGSLPLMVMGLFGVAAAVRTDRRVLGARIKR